MSIINIPNSPSTEAILINEHELPGQSILHRSRFVGNMAISSSNPEMHAERIHRELIEQLQTDPVNPHEIQRFKGYNFTLIEDRTIGDGPIVAVRPISFYRDGRFEFVDLPIAGREFSDKTTPKLVGVIEGDPQNRISADTGVDARAIWVFRAGNFLPLKLKRNAKEGIYIPGKKAFERINKRDLRGCIGAWSTIDEMGRNAPKEAWDLLDKYANRLLADNSGLRTELK